jgi:hypothetical protein
MHDLDATCTVNLERLAGQVVQVAKVERTSNKEQTDNGLSTLSTLVEPIQKADRPVLSSFQMPSRF